MVEETYSCQQLQTSSRFKFSVSLPLIERTRGSSARVLMLQSSRNRRNVSETIRLPQSFLKHEAGHARL